MATRTPAPRRASPRSAAKTPAAKKKTPSRSTAPAKPAAVQAALENSAPAAKPPKRKPVRDSFTMPRDEYASIAELKLRLGKLGRLTKKSELLRAGVKLLAALSDTALLRALQAVPPIKTGRPNRSAEPAPDTLPR